MERNNGRDGFDGYKQLQGADPACEERGEGDSVFSAVAAGAGSGCEEEGIIGQDV